MMSGNSTAKLHFKKSRKNTQELPITGRRGSTNLMPVSASGAVNISVKSSITSVWDGMEWDIVSINHSQKDATACSVGVDMSASFFGAKNLQKKSRNCLFHHHWEIMGDSPVTVGDLSLGCSWYLLRLVGGSVLRGKDH